MSGSFLKLGSGEGVLALGSGDRLLLGNQVAKVPVVIDFDDETLVPDLLYESITGEFEAKLVDEDGAQVEAGVIQAIQLVVTTGVNNATVLRHDDAHNANDVTITEKSLDTFLTWLFDTQDTRLVTRSNTREQHKATFQFGWNAASTGSGSNLISTTASSNLATITVTGHGISTTDTQDKHRIFLATTAKVGGVTIAGRYVIKRATDANTLEIRLPCKASSEESNGGGTVEWWLNGRASVGTVDLPILRADPYCE